MTPTDQHPRAEEVVTAPNLAQQLDEASKGEGGTYEVDMAGGRITAIRPVRTDSQKEPK